MKTAGPAERTTTSPDRPASRCPRALPGIAWLALAALQPVSAAAGDSDPHYGPAGFFDIHVCNWPGRSPFFMTLFSSERYAEIESVEVFTPAGEKLTDLDLHRYRTIQRNNKPDKRVFITQVDVSAAATSGWYSARTHLMNGETHAFRDFVILQEMPQAGGLSPANEAELDEIPQRLSWQPVPGAAFYQVFIHDLWDDNRQILESKLLTSPELVLPPGLLQQGGLYSWVVHARDTNEDTLLGDFNHGSLNAPAKFSIRE